MPDDIISKIGEKIRKVRRSGDLSLKELYEKTGISVSMLSKIETAQTSPSISTYANIASALGVSLGDLITDDLEEPEISIVRSSERPVTSRGKTYVGSPLAFKKNHKKMEPFIFRYPFGKTSIELLQHENEEMIFVIEGTIEFRYGEKKIILEGGDCIYFNGKILHGARALKRKDATVIVIQSNG